MGECRPDIALLDKEENVLAVIEIVDTHKPKESVLQYYEENKIVLIQINLLSEEDLNKVEEKITNPDFVDFCLSPKCQNFDKYKINRKILVHPVSCGRCLHPIEKYYIGVDSVFGKQVSSNFTENEINLVKSERQDIEIKINQTTKEKYPASICLNCKRIRSKYRRFRL